MLKLLIFDMDGVIFDTMEVAQKNTMESHPGMTEEAYMSLHSGNFREELAKHTHLRVAMTEKERQARKVAYAEIKSKAGVFPGMRDLLVELHQSGIKLILNTSAYERNTFPLLENAGIRTLFDLVATAEVSKSKREKFVLIEKLFGVEKTEVLFITDTLGDIREAELEEVPTVAVTWGVHDETYFTHEKHDNLKAIVHTVAELKRVIGSRR